MLIAVVLASRLLAAQSGAVAGFWSGQWIKSGDPINVTVELKSSGIGLTGSFESDDLQAAGIPFSSVLYSGGQLSMRLQGDDTVTSFLGQLTQDHLTGTFNDGGVPGTFDLIRTAEPPSLTEQEVTFADENVNLSGTVIQPSSTGRHPAILFLHGSGPEGRWANRYLALKFARRGFVALIFDKRGVGKSTGDWKTSGLEDLAHDGEAGLRLLKARPDVDPGHVGIYGHSQGGSVAPLVAEGKESPAFVIAASASGVDPAECETYSVENTIGVNELPDAEKPDARAFVSAIVDVGYRGKSWSELARFSDKFRDRSWYFAPPPADAAYWTISKKISKFRPSDHWSHVSAPVLLVYGDLDKRVPPLLSRDAILAALKAGHNTHVVVKVFLGADHTLTLPTTRSGGWPKKVSSYADSLIDWSLKQK